MDAHMHNRKQRLLAQWPKSAIYARYLKNLYRGEIELRLLPWLCDPVLTSVDVGAYHGVYTLGASLFSKRVIAVEPQAHLARVLRKSLPRNASLIEGALSRRPGMAAINIPVTNGDSTASLDLGSAPHGDARFRSEPVTLMRLDDVVTERLGFVKIDVDGHELEVLEGAQRIISSDKPALLIEAEQPGSVDAVTRLLHGFGYKGYFVLRSFVRPINEFRIETHQDVSRLGSGDRASYSDYINNFIFVQRAEALPQTVPSAVHALASSLQKMFRHV